MSFPDSPLDRLRAETHNASPSDGSAGGGGLLKIVVLVLLAIVLFVTLLLGSCGGVKEYSRYQKRQDAKNRTSIVHQQIKTANQQAQVVHAQNAAVQAKAEQRVIEAEGIRRAQDKISKTLTPLYVQHEAIRAQENDRKGDRTYIPVGPQGVPMVADVTGNSVTAPTAP